jgi:hypothetical protein
VWPVYLSIELLLKDRVADIGKPRLKRFDVELVGIGESLFVLLKEEVVKAELVKVAINERELKGFIGNY